MLSAPVRPLPDFLLIGAKRSGTTSLYRYLVQHPGVPSLFPPSRFVPGMREDMKGVHWFDLNFERGQGWYRSHFATRVTRARLAARVGGVAAGEASPYYLVHPLAAARAAEAVPAAKVLVLLRDPVERAWSHWAEQRRIGRETLDFDAALEAESWRTAGEEERLRQHPHEHSEAHEHFSYRSQGEYRRHLDPWLEAFGDLLLLTSEEFYADPQRTYDRVLAFLGLGPHQLASTEVFNAAARPSAMTARTRASLRAHFAPWNRELTERTGLEHNWPAE